MQLILNHPLTTLSSKLDICATYIQGEVVYVDYPVHGNVGDLLIWMGTEAFFRRHDHSIKGRFSFRTGNHAKNLMKKCDTICLHGGGNFGDIYPTYQEARRRIIKNYPDKRIVILPQTVCYRDKETMKNDCTLFKEHPDLHIFLRDQRSLAALEKQGLRNIELCPDMAHALWEMTPSAQAEEKSILYLFRKDEEKTALPQSLRDDPHRNFDWPDLLNGMTNWFCYNLGYTFDRINGRLLGSYLPSLHVWQWEAERLIRQAVDLFSRNETIISNRLHAMILAILLKKKAVIYDNSYGKLSSYYDLWLQGVPDLLFFNEHISSQEAEYFVLNTPLSLPKVTTSTDK